MNEFVSLNEEIALWNSRAKKGGLQSVMCSDFTESECVIADQNQKHVISELLQGIGQRNRGLEIGAGYGRLSPIFKQYINKLVVTDISFAMLSQVNDPSVTKVITDTTALSFPDGYFDFIGISAVLGHIRSDEAFYEAMNEVTRVSTQNGYLYIDEMTGKSNEYVAGRYRIRNPEEILAHLSQWNVIKRKDYSFGPQSHSALILQKHS